MNQRGYINIIPIVLVVILTGVVGYLTLVKKPTPPAITKQILPTNTTVLPTPEEVPTGQVYENQYLKVTVPAGWTVAQASETVYVEGVPQKRANPAAVNITKDNYILYINTRAQQTSGIIGGRFSEIAIGAPSADAVIQVHSSGPCSFSETYPAFDRYSRVDLYINNKETKKWCNAPSDGSTVWYFSYITDDKGGYFNYYKEGESTALVITMAYNSKDINKLPKKDSAELKTMLNEMTNILETLKIKSPTILEPILKDETANWKTYRNEKYGFEVKHPFDVSEGKYPEEWYFWLHSGEAKKSFVALQVADEPSVPLSGTYGGRFNFMKAPQSPAIKDRVLTEKKKFQDLDFTIDYWIAYGGMGSWDTVINAYTRKDNKYYSLSLIDTFISGVPESEVSKEQLVQKALKAMRDESNQSVKLFYQILSTFKFIVTSPKPAPDIDLIYPNGGEVFSLNQPINISYKISSTFKQKLSATDKTEIYLLDSQNVLVGYIGDFDVNNTKFVFNPQQLFHNAGLDMTSGPTPPGQYRILLVVRPAFKVECEACDSPVDTLDNPYIKYSNSKFIDINDQLIEIQPIASDVSASLFTIK